MATVEELYGSVLNREADTPGLEFWTNAYGSGDLTPEQIAQFTSSAQTELAGRSSPENLQKEFANIGEITQFTPADEGGGYTAYNANPEFQRTTEFGRGLSNIRPAEFSSNADPIASEYGIIPSEQTATPTVYKADLTAPDKDGYYLTAKFTPEGEMIGSPEREKYEPDWFRKNQNLILALPAIVAGGYALLPELLGEAGIASTIGELGVNTGLAAGEVGGIASGTSLMELPSFNLGQTLLPDAPGAVQQGVNRFATGLATSGGDPKAGGLAVLTGGLGDLGNAALADVPSAIRTPLVNVASQVAQGKDIEGAIKGAVAGSLSSLAGSGVSDITDSKMVGNLTSNAIKQLIMTGEVDPTKLTTAALNNLANTISSTISGSATDKTGGLGQALLTGAINEAMRSEAAPTVRNISPSNQAAQTMATTSNADQQANAISISQSKASNPAAQVDVSTLMPIKMTSSSSGPPLKVDVSKLTPITSASKLSSIIGSTKGTG